MESFGRRVEKKNLTRTYFFLVTNLLRTQTVVNHEANVQLKTTRNDLKFEVQNDFAKRVTRFFGRASK